MLTTFEKLPVEIFEEILLYLPFETVLFFSNNVSKKLYNRIKHNVQRYIIYDNLPAIKWIYENDIDQFCKTSIYNFNIDNIDLASSYGHLDIVKFLTEKNIGNATVEAMNIASRHGYLEVVKFLHYNRGEGCTNLAIDWAAKYGHFEIVKFLCENRNEGFTKLALHWSDKNHHKEIYDYLKSKKESF